jgi:hypothetical protein
MRNLFRLKIIRTICEKQVLNILIFGTFKYFMSKYKPVSNFLSNNNAPVISLMSVIPHADRKVEIRFYVILI